MEKEQAHILVSTDARFAPGAWVVIWSAWSTWRGAQPLQFHLLAKDPADPAIARMGELAGKAGIDLEISGVDTKMVDAFSSSRWSASSYVRVIAPRLRPDLKKFLYLDADVLVRDSLHPLFDLPEEKPAYAAGEYGLWSLGVGLPYLKLSPEEARLNYSNAGVLMINVRVWNDYHATEKMLEFLDTYKEENRCADQDGINGVLGKVMGRLDYVWNHQLGGFDYLDIVGWPSERSDLKARREEVQRDAKVVHFFPNPKPWMDYIEGPFTEEYCGVLKASGWYPAGRQMRESLVWFLKRQRLRLRALAYRYFRTKQMAQRNF